MSSSSSSIENSLSRAYLWEDSQEKPGRIGDFWRLSRNHGPWFYPAWKMRFGVLSQELRRVFGYFFLPGVPLDPWSYSIGNTSTCVYNGVKSLGTRCPGAQESLKNRRAPHPEAVLEWFKGKEANT